MTLFAGKIDLQLFAEEKTEKATPKKRREAREKGQVRRSVEINSAFIIISMFGALKFLSSYMLDGLEKVYRKFLYVKTPLEIIYTDSGLYNIFKDTLFSITLIVAPILGCGLLIGLVANYMQIGFLFTTKPLVPQFSRLNPIEGFKRIFSKRSLVELLKSFLKLAVIGSIAYSQVKSAIEYLPNILKSSMMEGVFFIADAVFSIGMNSGVALVGLAAVDFFYQWWDYEKNLMMSKQEVIEEYKQTEGNPQIRSKIREKQRELNVRRMMQEIPNADVVIVNPSHFAVALRYDPKQNDAPVVVAKGQDYIALKIKQKAKESNIMIVENKPLARALYHTTDIGQAIPPDLFGAVAEVLAFVYSLQNRNVFN